MPAAKGCKAGSFEAAVGKQRTAGQLLRQLLRQSCDLVLLELRGTSAHHALQWSLYEECQRCLQRHTKLEGVKKHLESIKSVTEAPM